MAFRSSLSSVLRYRESIEKRKEMTLQQAEFEVARAHKRVDELTTQLELAQEAAARALRGTIPAHRLHEMEAERKTLLEFRQMALDTLRTLKDERDAKRKDYQIAHTNRQMMSDLVAQQRSVWEQQRLRTEQKQLDDIFSARRQRN